MSASGPVPATPTQDTLLCFRPALAYDLAPWLGRYAALAFIVIWATSAWAYFSGTL